MEYIIVMDKLFHKRTDKSGCDDISSEDFLLYSTNCWYIQVETDRRHPVPFPVEMPYRLINFYTWKDDIVLDPFVGSGSTLVAAKILGHRYIGIDISEEYCNYAIERITKCKNEERLVQEEIAKHNVVKTFKDRKLRGDFIGKYSKNNIIKY